MKYTVIAKPTIRSKLRLALGKTYYTLLRFIQWKEHEPYAKSFMRIPVWRSHYSGGW